MTRWRRFARLPRSRQSLLIEAALQLAWARLELRLFSFARVAARLGLVSSPADAAQINVSAAQNTPIAADVARNVGSAVARAARHVPFEAVCLPQAIAAKRMLARRGVQAVMHFGVAQGLAHEGSLVAHAWVDAGGVEVTGYPVESRFKEVARFS
jgi:hypothetical protein